MSQGTPTFVAAFIEALVEIKLENIFNPYRDVCPHCDQPNAPAIRRANLTQVLTAAIAGGVDSIWLARDLGYRGGRRTGLALTDEQHLASHGARFSTTTLQQATQGPPVAERTAKIVWQALEFINSPILLWNIFPFHPHPPGNPLSNRCHTRKERHVCRDLQLGLMAQLNPQRVVAIGRDAQLALADWGIQAIPVRHPSYGGEAEFLKRIAAEYPHHPSWSESINFCQGNLD
jgi:hypothetical protein